MSSLPIALSHHHPQTQKNNSQHSRTHTTQNDQLITQSAPEKNIPGADRSNGLSPSALCPSNSVDGPSLPAINAPSINRAFSIGAMIIYDSSSLCTGHGSVIETYIKINSKA